MKRTGPAARRARVFPGCGVRVAPSFWLLPAATLLAGAPEVTAAVLLAAALHEGGHLALLAAFHVSVEGLRLSAFGATIHARGARRLSYGRELAVTLAGPAVNLLAAPLFARLAACHAWEWGYLFAGAHLLLGVYNLLPAPPLDGGRALYLLTAYCFGPDAGDKVSAAVGLTAALLLTVCGAYLTFALRGGAFFLLAALGLLAEACRAVGLIPRRFGAPSA